MPLNPIQVAFVGTARAHLETFIRATHNLDVFVDDYKALQASVDALPEDTTILDDNVDGTAPRTDNAPTLTGMQIKILHDRSASMSSILTPTEKELLIGKMVRSLATVLRVGE